MKRGRKKGTDNKEKFEKLKNYFDGNSQHNIKQPKTNSNGTRAN
jgi:hypothetical protein